MVYKYPELAYKTLLIVIFSRDRNTHTKKKSHSEKIDTSFDIATRNQTKTNEPR